MRTMNAPSKDFDIDRETVVRVRTEPTPEMPDGRENDLSLRTRDLRSDFRSASFLAGAFLLPAILIVILLILRKIHPFGQYSPVNGELYDYYMPLMAEYRRKLLSAEDLFYSWNIGYGINFFALVGRYLSSPLNLLLLLFPESAIPDVITLQFVLRAGISGLGMAWFLSGKIRLRSAYLIALSSGYAVGGYMLAYFWDASLTEAMVILPFVMLGAFRIMTGRNPIVFVVSFFLLIVCAWRSVPYVGLFFVLYLPLLWFESGGSLLPRKERRRRKNRIVIYSVLSLGVAAFLVLPSLLSYTAAAGWPGAFRFPDDLKMHFTFFDMADRLLFRTNPELSLRSPNIYCGLLAPVMVVLYASCNRIPFRERLYSLILIAFLYVTMSGSLIDYALNGLSVSSSDHFRMSFLVSFLLTAMAAGVIRYLEEIPRKTILLAMMGIFAFLIINHAAGEVQRAIQSVYGTAILVGIFGFGTRAVSGNPRRKRYIAALILLIVAGELGHSVLRAADMRIQSDGRATYALSGRYAEMVRDGIGTDPGVFDMRIAADPILTDFDGAAAGVMIPTAPAVYLQEDLLLYARRTGFRRLPDEEMFAPGIYSVNGMLLRTGAELLLYKEFITAGSPENADVIGDVVEGHVSLSGSGSYINPRIINKHAADEIGNYNAVKIEWNEQALPIAYRVDPAVSERYDAWSDSPFDNINDILIRMGLSPLYREVHYSGISTDNITVDGDYYIVEDQDAQGSLVIETESLTAGDRLAIYIGSQRDVNVSVFSKQTGRVIVSSKVRSGLLTDFKFLAEAGMQLSVRIVIPIGESNRFPLFLAVVSDEAMADAFRALSNEALRVEKRKGSHLDGVITTSNSGALFFSVPYDKGWIVRVDGKPVATRKAAEAWLSAPLSAGTHRITARYTPPGFAAGLAISLICLAAIILLFVCDARSAKTRISANREADRPEEGATERDMKFAAEGTTVRAAGDTEEGEMTVRDAEEAG